MRADEDNLVPQHRVRAGYLGENIVAVRIILVEPRSNLDAQLRRRAGLNHPDQHVVMLGGQHRGRNGVAGRAGVALNARAVFHGAGRERDRPPPA